MELKDRIKSIRKENKLTQVEFGKSIGVKGNTITNYETGLRNPTDAVIKSICHIYKINEEWLRTGEGEKYWKLSEDEEIAGIVSDLLEDGKNNALYTVLLEIVKTYNELSPASQKVLTEAAEKLADNLAKKKRD